MPALIVPTPAFRRRVHPRRGHPFAPVGKDTWSGFLERWNLLRSSWVRGAEPAAGLHELALGATALLDGAAWPDEPPVEQLAAAERMLNAGASLVGAVAARYGAAVALRVKVRSLAFAIGTARDADKRTYWTLTPADASPRMFETGWNALRWVTCAADDAAYAAARQEADRLRQGADLSTRVLVAYAFPSEPGWANADLQEANAVTDFARHVSARSALLASASDEDLAAGFLARCEPWGTEVAMSFGCDLLLGLGVEAGTRVLLAELSRALGRRARAGALTSMAAVLTSVQSEPVADALAPLLRHEVVGRYVATYFEHAPALARHALSPLAGAKSLLGDAARHVLAQTERPTLPEATEPQWPAVLRDAPWRRRWSARPVTLQLAPLPYTERIEWASGERDALCRAELPGVGGTATMRIMSPEERAEFEALPRSGVSSDVWMKWQSGRWSYFAIPEDLALELWTDPQTHLQRRTPLHMLAKFGEAGLAGLFARSAFGESSDIFDASLRVDSPRVAEVCARAMTRRRPWRRRAMDWLVAHAEAAAVGLLPVALGGQQNALAAQRGLLLLAARGHREVVMRIAERLGATARDATLTLLDEDPLGHIDEVRLPPLHLRPESLPPLCLRSGRALPHEGVTRVLEVLRGMRPELPYPGVALLREALDPESSANFARALLDTWDLRGRRRVDEWMARSVVHLSSGEKTIHQLISLSRDFAQRDSSACILLLEILAAIGGDEGGLHIAAIADASGLETLATAAKRLLGEERARDPIVPTLGLDEHGVSRFDLGSRTVTFSLDEMLRPVAWLEGGRRLAQLPRPSKDDDPVLATRALAAWRAFCRDSRVIAETQPRRFERAMVEGRLFSKSELDAIAAHPALGHLARRLVWGVFAPELVLTFRIEDKSSLLDVDDRPCRIGTSVSVGIVHAIVLDEDTRSRWASLFADYEILQPFEQLAREVHRPDAGVRHGAEIRIAATAVAVPSLLALFDSRGWKRPMSGFVHNGWRHLRLKAGQGVARAELSFAPGAMLGEVARAQPQKLGNVKLIGAKSFAEVNEVDVSELLRDVAPWRAHP